MRLGGRLKCHGGATLIEALFYCATFSLVVGSALASLYAASMHHKRLDRSADAIVRVVEAGQRWREEIRAASGPVQVETSGPGGELQTIRIPGAGGEVTYRQEADRIVRTDPGGSTELFRVRSSRVSRVPARVATDAWQWEVELALDQ